VERYGDPIYNSIMDECLGHTANEYHYHAFHQPCLTDGVREGQRSPILGYALDGFPIRGPYGCADADCHEVIRMKSGYKKIGDPTINAWQAYRFEKQEGPEYLDRCNGHTAPNGDYHYHATSTFPYIIGCYSGSPILDQARGGPPDLTQNRGRRPRGGGPPRRGGPIGPGGQRGPGGLETAAPRLGLTVERLAEVVDQAKLRAHLRDPENVSFDFAGAARELGVNEEELRQALEHQVDTPVRYKGNRPGCTMTPEGYLLCHPNAVHGLVDQVQGGRK
jgi:YHYH protein